MQKGEPVNVSLAGEGLWAGQIQAATLALHCLYCVPQAHVGEGLSMWCFSAVSKPEVEVRLSHINRGSVMLPSVISEI